MMKTDKEISIKNEIGLAIDRLVDEALDSEWPQPYCIKMEDEEGTTAAIILLRTDRSCALLTRRPSVETVLMPQGHDSGQRKRGS